MERLNDLIDEFLDEIPKNIREIEAFATKINSAVNSGDVEYQKLAEKVSIANSTINAGLDLTINRAAQSEQLLRDAQQQIQALN